MKIKFLLYLIVIFVVTFVISKLNIEKYFKKNAVLEIVVAYLLLTICISYLVVNFLIDIYIASSFGF